MLHEIKVFLIKIFFILVGYLPAKKNLIIFESYVGRQYSCNPRAIYEYMCVHHPEYEMYWSVDPNYTENFKEKDLKILKRYTIPSFSI